MLGDPRFFSRAGPFDTAQVAAAAGIVAPGTHRLFTGVAPLQAAGPDEISFLHNPRYTRALTQTRAGAAIVTADLAARVPEGCVALVAADAHAAWAHIAGLFHPPHPATPGTHPSAVVDASASIDASADIGPNAVIGPRAEIGPRCRIGAGAVIGAGVVLGQDCRIGALASISHAILGERVFVYPGARVGQEGFGFAMTKTGFLSVPQLGRVLVEDDVEIGANSCVDRGAAQDTVIGAGTRLDNLVQIGHNVRLGRCCVIVAQAGISGSTVVEDFAQIGAQVGIAGHVTIGARARIGGQAGVMSDVAPGADVVGSPAMPVREFFRNVAVLRRLARKTPAPQARTDGRDD
jgi:UDP-3-O-[3-hydroxymyristoyl] glucosamine N-acyltransferase